MSYDISELILVNTSYEEDVLEGSYQKFGYRISSRTIGSAKKRKILVTVPYMNGHYDFSYMPITEDPNYQQNIYDNRTFTYVFQIPADDDIALHNKFTAFNDWLTRGIKRRFRDSVYPSLEWYGEVTDTALAVHPGYGEVTVTMSVYPFAHNIYYEGGDLWDELNFEWDVIQPTEFTISRHGGTQTVEIYVNSSINQNPKIYMEADDGVLQLRVNSDIKMLVNKGYNTDSRFILHPGNNLIFVDIVQPPTKDPKIQFLWQREMA